MSLVRHIGAIATTALGLAAPQLAQAQLGTTREEVQRAATNPLPRTAGQRVSVEGDVERAPCPLASPEFANINLTLASVEFGDLKGISPDILKSSYGSLVGQTIPIAAVCDIRDRAATILRSRGYLAAVQVPPQRIENGVVKFDVLLARVVDFQVRGNAGKAEGLIAGYLGRIKDQPVFNIVDAERYLLLARDLPGYDVRLTLRPAGTVPGEVIGEVQVVYTPVEAELNLQNYGSKTTGREGGLAQIHFNGLFGTGDRTTLAAFTTADFEEQQVFQAREELRVGSEGLVLAASIVHAWSRPDLGAGLDLRSRTLAASIEARYPIIRRQTNTAYLSGGLDLTNQRVRFNGLPFTKDRLRVAYLRLDADSVDPSSMASTSGYSPAEPRWRAAGSLELRHGVSIFGASDGCGPGLVNCAVPGATLPSKLEADPTAFVARLQGLIEYRPVPKLTFALQPRLQYANKPLLGYEEFSGGSFSIGRGYDPGIVTGDSGIGLSGEVRYGSLIPQTSRSMAWQVYAFTDAAWLYNKDRLIVSRDPERLVSAGGGVRMAFGDRFNFDVGAAIPLRKTGLQVRRSDTRILANLTVKLLPWTR